MYVSINKVETILMNMAGECMLITICDDILKEAEKIKGIVKQYVGEDKSEIKLYSPEGMLLDIEASLFKSDIVILDIKFQDKEYNGIDIGKQLNKVSPLSQIIYITNFDYFHSDVYDTNHCYFVKKESMDKTLPRALAKAVNIIRQNENKEYIKIAENGKTIYIKQRDIRTIEKSDRVIVFYLENEKYMSYISVKTVLKDLSDSFARSHSGYIVNFEYIETVTNEKIMMKGGKEIPVGRAFRKEFMKLYLKYLTDRI